MARRIRWQIVIAVLSAFLVGGLLGRVALSTASVASPLAGGSYVEAVVGSPLQPIPLLNDPVADPAGRDLVALLFDGLVRVGADGLIEPALAASYTLDESGTVYLFTLRQDAVWHDGQPVTAADVVFTLRALQILEQPGEPLAAAAWADALVDRIDDHTVRVTLPAPFAPFLSMARVPILPAHLLAGTAPDRWPAAPFARQLVGTGPYRLVELRDDRALLEANQSYFGGRPYLDRVELRFVTAPEAAQAALTRGDVMAYGERATPALAGVSLPSNLRRSTVPLDEYALLSFNLRDGPLAEQPLRLALAHGISKDAIIERALGGLAAPLDTPILPGSWAYAPEVQWHGADPEAARRILSELGFEPGADGVLRRNGQALRLELLVEDGERPRAVADEVARQWGELGIDVEVLPLEALALQQRLRDGRFTVALHSWAHLGPDPDPFLYWHSQGGLNVAGLDDEQIDELIESARTEDELAARSADYAAFQQRWVELAPSITLYQPLYLFASARQLGGTGLDDPDSAISRLLFGQEDRYRAVTRWYTNSYRAIEGDLR
ncbi:MAG: peptide ABC transporter substrate-binding protein [Chloroflexales bacterium]|nr:peptide ABC transporter substrate-binding protein [Chloroflexales bacterium]